MAEKTIIANYGDRDLGKSQSILMVYEMLKVAANDRDNKPLQTNNGDVCAVLEINGVKVGICSQGDPKSCQKGWMDTLVNKEECTIILAACRYNGATADLIVSYKKQGYRIYWTENARFYQEEDKVHWGPIGLQHRFNEQWATEIANMIESWCYA